jgi:hypothetical protein
MKHICNQSSYYGRYKGRPMNGWQYCGECNGRIHFPECTTKLNWKRDCCDERHNRLTAGEKISMPPLE